MSSLPPKVTLLDVREAAEPALAGSVWIPFLELPKRMGELPPPGAELEVVRELVSDEALAFLHGSGRVIRFVQAAFGVREPGRLWSPHPWLESFSALPETGLALDLGCGNGREAAFLVAFGMRVIGVDRHAEAVGAAETMVARYAPNGDFEGVVADFDTFAPSEPVDLIVCLMAMPVGIAGLAETWLKPGGYLLGEAYSEPHRAATGTPRDARRTFEAQLSETNLKSVRREAHEGRIRYLFQRL